MKQITLEEARRWCVEAHGDQTYGRHPYEFHLDRVAEVAVRFGFVDDLTLMKCYGHDVIEDTDKEEADMLNAGFPEDVVEDVSLVSDEPGETRKERKTKTLAKIATKRSAILVKLCDRIANVEHSKRTKNEKKFSMYKEEHADFEAALRDHEDKELEVLWLHLETLFAD